jgi:hypothetical protein
MLTLAELQSRFRDTVLGADAEHLKDAVADDRLGFANRLNVYRNNTMLLLREALAENFPVTYQIVGEDFFASLARAFVKTHPPRSSCLFEYGDGFADFIDTFPGIESLPYLSDVARLDWAQDRALHAADVMPVSASDLSKVSADDYGRLVFALHPATHVVTSSYPLHAIWALHQPQANSDETVKLDSGGEAVLITRPHADVCVSRLLPGEDVFIERLDAGCSLEAALTDAQTHTHTQKQAFDTQHALTALLLSGALAGHALQ